MGDVEGARGRALGLGQLVLLLACLALCESGPKELDIGTLATKPLLKLVSSKH